MWTVNLALGTNRSIVHELTGQFANKQTRGQSSRGLVSSQTSQLADRVYFLNHGHIIIYCTQNENLTLTLTI